MWQEHWRLDRDPFLGPRTAYVPTAGHREAIARVAYAIENRERVTLVQGPTGIGKSLVIGRAIGETRTAARRFARLDSPSNLSQLMEGLALAFGIRDRRSPPARAFRDALRLQELQKIQPVVILDGLDSRTLSTQQGVLRNLVGAANHCDAGLTLVLSTDDSQEMEALLPDWRWCFRAPIPPLVHSETERYVLRKFETARGDPGIFQPEALAWIHERSGGVPRAVDRLATQALMAGALQNWNRIEREPLEDIATMADPAEPILAA